MFYEMLTGERPFTGSGPAELLYQHAFGDRPVLPEAFSRYQPFLARVLAIEPDERPASAEEMLAAFDAIDA